MMMTEMVAGISRASIEREAAMMEASSNFIWARKIRALRAALDKAEAERDRLRAKLDDAAVALDAAGMELSDFANCLSREPWAACLAHEAAIDARAALKGETP
jgi:hypothetical protein